MEIVYFDDWPVTDAGCFLKAVAWTAPVKKQYVVDVPGADGSIDMASWFGGPRYEARTMTVVLIPFGRDTYGLWNKLAQRLYGSTYDIRLSTDPDHYWHGDVQSIIASEEYQGEVVITVRVDPYKYAVIPTTYGLASSTADKDTEITNNGTRLEVPKITVTEGGLRIVSSDGAVINMQPGTYDVPELAIAPRSALRFQYSGGPAEITFREAYL